VVAGFNAPNRVLLTRDAHPGQRFVIAVFGINDPISASPRNYIWLRTATLDFYTAQRARVTAPAELVIERANPRLDAIITADATLERIAGGFESTAGPVWSRDGSLLFSSPAMNTIYRWQPTGQVTVFRPKSGYSGVDIGRYPRPGSNGLALDPQARLTICELGNRRVVRIEPHGNLTVLAGRFDGRRLNGPADLVYRTDGTLFFTDPASDLPERSGDPGRELPFSGVFAVRDGQVTLVTGELEGPGGLAFSPDERHLYVGNCERGRQVVMRYELGAAGHEVVEAGVLADLTGAGGENAIGGLTVDQAGHVYVCGPGGIWVISPAGEHLGTVRLPEAPANLTWGDSDAQTLYITAVTSVYRVRLHIPGSHVH
jgi:gluconolactonase